MLLAAAMVVGAQNVASSMFEKNWSCLYVLTSVMTRMRREVRKLRARTKPWKRRRTRREKKKLKVNDGSHFNHNTKALPNTDVCPPPHTHTLSHPAPTHLKGNKSMKPGSRQIYTKSMIQYSIRTSSRGSKIEVMFGCANYHSVVRDQYDVSTCVLYVSIFKHWVRDTVCTKYFVPIMCFFVLWVIYFICTSIWMKFLITIPEEVKLTFSLLLGIQYIDVRFTLVEFWKTGMVLTCGPIHPWDTFLISGYISCVVCS